MSGNQSVKEVMVNCADSSSLHGLPKIASSKQLAVKALWCLLLLGAIGVCTYQIYELLTTYKTYPVQTSVSLHTSQLDFPAVTICNMNPIRYSKILDVDEIKTLLFGSEQLQPDSQQGGLDDLSDLLSNDTDLELYDWIDLLYNDINVGVGGDGAGGSNEADSADAYYIWHDRIMSLFRALPPEDRKYMGHDIDTMLHSAKFAGFNYYAGEFNVTLSPEYGNCYTLGQLGLKAKMTGTRNGLRIVLNLETAEHLAQLSSGSGARLVIHEPNTLPHPEEDGITLSPGYETNIAMKLIKMNRLGPPYGDCSEPESIHGYTSTLQYCNKLCAARHAIAGCGCMPYTTLDIFSLNTPVCKTNVDLVCVRDMSEPNCDCESPCTEVDYTTVISGRQWPNRKYLDKVVMKESCSRNITSMGGICLERKESDVTDFNYQSFAANFLAVNIYYERLNYQVINEKPLYTPVSLLSDIGGIMGFYVGASVLTYVEILQFVLEIILYFSTARARRKTTAPTVEKS